MEDEGGYDAQFVYRIPDNLKCVVCHFALKDPLQIACCGHRFCKICFVKMEVYARERETEFLCPLDRGLISNSQVFSDRAAARDVLGRQVKCSHHKKGCVWENDLRELQDHVVNQCDFEVVQCSFERCFTFVERRFLDTHTDSCCWRKIECDSCKDEVLAREIEQHKAFCGKGSAKSLSEYTDISLDLRKLATRLDECERQLQDKDDLIKDNKLKLLKKNEEILKLTECVNRLQMEVNSLTALNPTGFFSWKILNCHHLRFHDDIVCTEPFYLSLNGYKCQLSARFCGPKGGRLELTFYLLRDENYDSQHWPFNMAVKYICYGQDNLIETHVEVPDNCCDEMIICDWNERSDGLVTETFLSMPQLAKYIIEDTLTIECHLDFCSEFED